MPNLPTKIEIPFKGDSMLPLLQEGDSILVEMNNDHSLLPTEVGDILLFKDDNQFFVHRLVSLKENFQVKGDHSLCYDNPEDCNPLGKVIGRIRKSEKLIWGEAGHPKKALVANLSKLYSNQYHRLIRFFAKTFIRITLKNS